MYRYVKEWRKNPQWSLSCCLALLLPLTDLQGEIRGMAGGNVLKQQMQTGKVDMPSMSGTFKDSGAVNFALEEEGANTSEERDHQKGITKKKNYSEQSVITLTKVSIHELSQETHDTSR